MNGSIWWTRDLNNWERGPRSTRRRDVEQQVKLKKYVFFSNCLREAPSKNSPTQRDCLEDCELLSLLHFAEQNSARGEIPPEIILTVHVTLAKRGWVIGQLKVGNKATPFYPIWQCTTLSPK